MLKKTNGIVENMISTSRTGEPGHIFMPDGRKISWFPVPGTWSQEQKLWKKKLAIATLLFLAAFIMGALSGCDDGTSAKLAVDGGNGGKGGDDTVITSSAGSAGNVAGSTGQAGSSIVSKEDGGAQNPDDAGSANTTDADAVTDGLPANDGNTGIAGQGGQAGISEGAAGSSSAGQTGQAGAGGVGGSMAGQGGTSANQVTNGIACDDAKDAPTHPCAAASTCVGSTRFGPDGFCCTGCVMNGKCYAGTSVLACGHVGNACDVCQPEIKSSSGTIIKKAWPCRDYATNPDLRDPYVSCQNPNY